MLSKSACIARIALACLLVAGCRSTTTRAIEQRSERPEINLAFTIDRNLLRLDTLTIDGRTGRFFLGSAHGRTLLSPAFAGEVQPRSVRLQLNSRESVEVEPLLVDLTGVGEAVVGFDAWQPHVITINYVTGLLTFLRGGMNTQEMTLYRFQDEPAVTVTVDGTAVSAAVDTANPDTLVLPRGNAPAGRRTARVEIAGTVFPAVDIALGDVSRARIGNRLLSKFLVSIDYGRQHVGLWRDPRIPLE